MDILALYVIGIPFVVLLFMGMPVAFVFLFIMMGASLVLMGDPVGPYMTINSFFNSVGKFTLAPVPFFVLMGELLLHSGLAAQSLDALSKLLGKIPGRLAILTNLAGALFGLLTGSTMASTAVMGSVLGPEMKARGYSKQMTYGPILASGGLAMIIPPSSLAIVYATTAEIPIGPLLIAGLLPGILMAVNYATNIMIRVLINPSLAPAYDVEPVPLKEKLRVIVTDLLPLGFIIFAVTGIFVLGIATPTESAALGAVATVLVTMAYRKLNWEVWLKSIKGTVTIATMTLFIVGGSEIFSRLLSYSGLSATMLEFLSGLDVPPLGLLTIMLGIVVVLGTFMESVPIILIVTPIFVPLASLLGFDQIWFAVLVLIAIQIGMTTPPFGMLLFVMKGIAGDDVTMGDMYRTALPFVISDLITITLIILFPAIALWLPSLLK